MKHPKGTYPRRGTDSAMAGRMAAVLVIFLIPGAAACTLAEEPAQPARFAVWNPDTDERHVIDFTERQLSAQCGLANGFAYDGRHFAWLAGGNGDLRPKLHLRELDTGKEWSEQLPASHSTDITLQGNRLYVVWLPDATQGWKAASVDLQLGDWQELGLPSWGAGGRGAWYANDGILAWVYRIHDGESFGIYDPVARQVRVDASQGSVIGWGGKWPGAYVEPGHFGSVQALGIDEEGVFVLDYVTRSKTTIASRTMDRNPTPLAVSGHDVLGSTFDNQNQGFGAAWRRNMVTDDAPVVLDIRDRTIGFHLLGIRGPELILGTYSADGLPEWGGPRADKVDSPGGSAALVLVALGLAAWRRLGQGGHR